MNALLHPIVKDELIDKTENAELILKMLKAELMDKIDTKALRAKRQRSPLIDIALKDENPLLLNDL